MKYERIAQNLLFYVDHIGPLVETLDVLANASDISDAFLIPIQDLRDFAQGLRDFHTTLRKEHELEVSNK